MNLSKFLSRSANFAAKRNTKCIRFRLFSNLPSTEATINDPAEKYFAPKVQELLRGLTGLQMEKVFEPKKLQKHLKAPKYEFMTQEELDKAMEEATKSAEENLQMPPYLLPRSEINKVLANDPALKGWDPDGATFVFTDISSGVKDSERLIVKRDPDGKLSLADWAVRDSTNQAFNPFPGRKWRKPKMFEPENLEDLLKRGEFIFVLDRACLQFEPNNPEYISITHRTYDFINEKKEFDVLRSTRHFGPLAFHLAWNKNIDNLLLDCLSQERLDDAVRAVELLRVLHPESQSTLVQFDGSNHLDVLKKYIEGCGSKRGLLDMAVRSLEELQESREATNTEFSSRA